MLFHKVDDKGEPVFPGQKPPERLDFLRDLALRRGMDPEDAAAWARKSFLPGRQNGAQRRKK